MASGPSIIATLGADTAPLKRDLQKAVREVEKGAEQMERAQNKAFKKLGGAVGGGAFGLASDVAGAFGLGTGLVASLGLLIPKLIEVRDAMDEAREARDKLLGPVQAASHTTEGALLQRLEATNKELKEMTRQVGFWEGMKNAAAGALALMGGNAEPLTRFMRGGGAGDNDTLLQRKEEIEQMIEAKQKGEEMRKEMNQMDADAQKRGLAARKELSDEASKEAAEAIKRINQEKSAEMELINIRSEQEGDRYEAEVRFQELAEKGREKMIAAIHDEEQERKKTASNINQAFKDAQDAADQAVHDRFIEGELGGADFRRERGRQERKERKAEAKFKRMRALADRGGHAAADVREVPPEVGPAIPVKPTATLDVTNNLLTEIKTALGGIFKSQ